MRIIAGEHRGRPLKAPKGEKTRPTTDRVRESMMSVVSSALDGFEGLWVLDAFAGSGALGLEALSRGAAGAVFFEQARDAHAVLTANLSTLGYAPPRALARRADVLKSPPLSTRNPFGLVFFDPPYAYDPEVVFEMAGRLRSQKALCADAVVVYEHALAAQDAVSSAAEKQGFSCFQRKSFGETGVSFFNVV